MKVGKSVWGGEDLQESLISVLSVLSRQFHAKHLFFFQLHVQILCSMHVVSSEVLYCVQKYCYRQFSSNAEAKVIYFFFLVCFATGHHRRFLSRCGCRDGKKGLEKVLLKACLIYGETRFNKY